MEIQLKKGDTIYIYDLSKWYLYHNEAAGYTLCSMYDVNTLYKITDQSASELLALGFNRKA